jgi:hypothetical protein
MNFGEDEAFHMSFYGEQTVEIRASFGIHHNMQQFKKLAQEAEKDSIYKYQDEVILPLDQYYANWDNDDSAAHHQAKPQEFSNAHPFYDSYYIGERSPTYASQIKYNKSGEDDERAISNFKELEKEFLESVSRKH